MLTLKTIKNLKKIFLCKHLNYLFYSISKLHSTYLFIEKRSTSSVEKILSAGKYFFFLFDNKNQFTFKKKNKIDLLIVSNLVNTNFNRDYYFGNLEKILENKKIKVIKVFRNLSNKKTKFFFQFKKKKLNLLSKRTKLTQECKYIYLFLREYLFNKSSRNYNLFKKKLDFYDYFSMIANMRTVDQITNVIKILNPKCIIFTFEGHAWERLLINECNKMNVVTIAHQFSTIAQNQVGIFKNLKNTYNPDYIATSGNITKNLFLKKSIHSQIFKLGSCKFQNKLKKNFKQKKILVAMDSDFVMMKEMLNFVEDLAIKNVNFSFIIRLHPLFISNFFYLNFIKKRIKNKFNIKISYDTLETDLKKSIILIYRESSICIKALNYNVRVFFFGNDKKLNSFDDKFPDQHIVKHPLNIDLILNKKYINKKYFDNYKKNYFTKFTPNNLIKVIKNV